MDQVIDLVELEEKYGAELVEELKIHIDWCAEKNLESKLEVIEENEYFITFAFVTYAFSRVCQIHIEMKKLTKNFMVGKIDCNKLLRLMNDFQAE